MKSYEVPRNEARVQASRPSGLARLHVELNSEHSRHLDTSILTNSHFTCKHVARPQVSMQCEAQCRYILLVLLYYDPQEERQVYRYVVCTLFNLE